jgi:hypothetical protein
MQSGAEMAGIKTEAAGFTLHNVIRPGWIEAQVSQNLAPGPSIADGDG